MPAAAPEWTEEEILMALHLRDHEGKSWREIGLRFGRTKSAVAGLLFRIDKATDEHDPDGNGNGTMKPLWWRR